MILLVARPDIIKWHKSIRINSKTLDSKMCNEIAIQQCKCRNLYIFENDDFIY